MVEYIERGQLLADIENTIRITAKDTGSSELRGARKVIARIKAMPSAEVQPVIHGYWKMHDICSVCDDLNEFQTNYCPNCGAKMDEDGE